MAWGADRVGRLEGWRRELVTRHLYLVRVHIRRRVYLPRSPGRRKEAADLYQEGYVELIEAALRYDPRRNGAFAPYALARVRRAVYRAIHEAFATVRIPMRTVQRCKARRAKADAGTTAPPAMDSLCRLLPLASLTSGPPASSRFGDPVSLAAEAEERAAGGETIGEHLREKCRIALVVAADRIAGRFRRAGRRAALAAITDERLGIPCEEERTPLRAIEQRYGVSNGRLASWQRAMEQGARQILNADGELTALRQASAESEAREDRAVDPALAALLTELRMAAFRRAVRAGAIGPQASVLAPASECEAEGRADSPETVFARLSREAQREVLARIAQAGPISHGRSQVRSRKGVVVRCRRIAAN